MDDSAFTSVALREARQFTAALATEMWIGALGGGAILGALAYFDVEIKWIIVLSFVFLVFAIGGILNSIARRFDMGRSYLEQMSSAIGADVTDLTLRS